MIRILINTPDLSLPGGVANHYKGLRGFWTQTVHYNFVGSRKGIPGALILCFDFLKFFFVCWRKNYDVIVLNPSLGKTAICRDAFFLKIAKSFNITTIVFLHGWNESLSIKIDRNPKKFTEKFEKADAFIVLANKFKAKIKAWGIDSPLYLTTTKVDDNLVEDFSIKNKKYRKTLLFLARIEENKGIITAIEAHKKVREKFPEAQLKIAGIGNALAKAKEKVSKEDISNVEFLGNVSGKNLSQAFSESSVYILPTTHGEGMPTSVLEAMTFGLPIISRPVGGLVDFFENEKMGYLLESLDAKDYSEKLVYLYENRERMAEQGAYNHNFAQKNFMASKVAKNLEAIFGEVVRNKKTQEWTKV